MKTWNAKDPSGKVHSINTARAVAFAIFLKVDGGYYPHFAKTMRAAKDHWGVRGVGITRAVEV